MPVLCRHDALEERHEAVDDLHHLVPFLHCQASPGAEIILHVDDKERAGILLAGHHVPPGASVYRLSVLAPGAEGFADPGGLCESGLGFTNQGGFANPGMHRYIET